MTKQNIFWASKNYDQQQKIIIKPLFPHMLKLQSEMEKSFHCFSFLSDLRVHYTGQRGKISSKVKYSICKRKNYMLTSDSYLKSVYS